MTRDQILDLCSDLPGAVEDYPFGEDVAVFKVGGMMFALVLVTGDPGNVTVKCDPEWALELRARYEAVRPDYHTNTRRWNTIELDETVEDAELREITVVSEFEALDQLVGADRAKRRMSDLAGDMYLSQSALSPTVARLENAGFVTRVMCSNDRRGIFVSLTDRGRAVHHKVRRTRHATLSEHLA